MDFLFTDRVVILTRGVWEGMDGYCASCAESATCTALFGLEEGWFWSSTEYYELDAWLIAFSDGYMGYSPTYPDCLHKVRCLRYAGE